MSPNPRGDTIVRWTIVIGVIDTLAAMLRFFVRKKSRTKIAADDWMIVASLPPAYCMIGAASVRVTKGGAGKHKADLTALEMTLILKYLIPTTITYGLSITAVKLSILLSYHRVFTNVNFKDPISAAWDPKLLFTNHCRDIQSFFVEITISNLLLDVIILCMPLPVVWNLNLSTRKKLEVSGVYLLGSCTCIASLMRILSIRNIKEGDFSYTFLNAYLWSHVEPATAILCACLMTYRPLFADISLKLQSVLGASKQVISGKKGLLNSKSPNSGTGPDSDASPSLRRGQESARYGDLSARATKGNLHVVNISMRPCPQDRRSPSPPPADEYECSRIAVGREASLV